MGVLLRGIVAVPLLFVIVVVEYYLGVIVPPIADIVLASDAVHSVGFASGAKIILMMGLRFVGALLGLVVVLWWIFGSLRRDVRATGGRRY